MSIGTNIYTLRKAKKLTQGQLAEKLGVSEQAVSKWENDICAPDVSLFPVIASFFGVSIDRLFGYHTSSYTEEVQKIIKAADDCGNIYDSIKIIEDGLARYPNSPDLKSQLAHSLFMVYLISTEDKARSEAVKRAIALCSEVADSCDDTVHADNALNMLRNIYCQLGDYKSALNAIGKISPENYLAKTIGKAQVLAYQNEGTEFAQFVEHRLLEFYLAMSQLFQLRYRTLMDNKEYEKSLFCCSAYEKLLSVFDDGCPGFFLPPKLWNIINKARTYQMLGDKENCLNQLNRYAELIKLIIPGASAGEYQIAARNPLHFSSLTGEDMIEEYITDFPLEFIFSTFDEFLGEDEEYRQFKKDVTC